MCVYDDFLWAYQSFIDIQDASSVYYFSKLFTITIADLSAAHLYKQCSDKVMTFLNMTENFSPKALEFYTHLYQQVNGIMQNLKL